MSVTPLQIIAAQQLTGSAATYYTSSAITTRVDKMTFTNTDTAAHQVTVYLIAVGGSASAANTITAAHGVAAGETWNCPDMVGQILPPGSFIQAFADTTLKVTISAAGTQIS